MIDAAPYFVDVDVPETVLLTEQSRAAVKIHPNACEAVWYKAAHSAVSSDQNGAIQNWQPEDGIGITATPVKPNTNQLLMAPNGGLIFEHQINSGVVIKNGLVDTKKFTCAVRYSSPLGEARSLLTINPAESKTYIFLTEKNHHIYWQDRHGEVELCLPAPQHGGWIVAGYCEGQLSLTVAQTSADFGPTIRSNTTSSLLVDAMVGASDIFIGCRSHRTGILKTLGTSLIHDILLWIDCDVNDSQDEILNAARRYSESKGKTG
jgi:hypothetical protein